MKSIQSDFEKSHQSHLERELHAHKVNFMMIHDFVLFHKSFSIDLMRMYMEQKEVLESMKNHLQDTSGVPFIISGVEGSGKSENVSRMLKMIEDECKLTYKRLSEFFQLSS